MKAIRNLASELYKVTPDERDTRFKSWCKFIDEVDPSKQNGFAFVGEFVRDGTVEIEVKPQLFLVAVTSGSMKYHNTTYRVVAMNAEGQLERTDIIATDKTPGWALRIRDRVAALLATLVSSPPSPREQFLAALRQRLPALTDDEIITAALNVFELNTRPE